MLKRSIALATALFMMLTLAACNGGGKAQKDGNTNLGGMAYTQQAFEGAADSGVLPPVINSAGELVTVSQQDNQPAVVTTWDAEGKKKGSVTTDVTDSVTQFALSDKDEVYLLASPASGNQTVHVLDAGGKTAKTIELDGVKSNQSKQTTVKSNGTGQAQEPAETSTANPDATNGAAATENKGNDIPDERQMRDNLRSQITAMQVAPDGGVLVAAMGSGVLQFDDAGKQVRTLGEGSMISYLAMNELNQLLVYTMGGGMGMGGGAPALKTYDTANGKELSSVEVSDSGNISAIFYDKAGKRLLVMTDSDIKVLGADGKAGAALASFSEFSLLNGSRQITNFAVDGKGTIYLAAYNSDTDTGSGSMAGVSSGVAVARGGGPNVSIGGPDGGGMIINLGGGSQANEMIRLGLVDASMIKERQVITLAAINGSRILNQAISAFQIAHPEYKIELKVYNTQVQGFKRGGEQFDITSLVQAMNTDFMAGRGADIIVLDSLPWYKYTDKGLLVDMAQLMADKQFDTSPYYGNIFDACKVNGKLYGIPMSFTYNVLTGKKSTMPESSSATLAEFIAKAKALPEGVTAFARQDALQIFYSYLQYSYADLVDTANHQAHFDSPEFIQAMKDFKELIGDNTSSENNQNFQAKMLDGSVGYNIESMSNPMALATTRAILGGDMAVTNVPTLNGTGSGSFTASLLMGINANSKNKDVAWEFIKSMLGEEIQGSGRMGGYPVLKSAAQNMVDEMKSSNTDGFEKRMILRMGDREIEVKPLTDEDCKTITDTLPTLSKLQSADPNIVKVLNEELPSFFDGQKTAEDVAALIQNRINTVLNE